MVDWSLKSTGTAVPNISLALILAVVLAPMVVPRINVRYDSESAIIPLWRYQFATYLPSPPEIFFARGFVLAYLQVNAMNAWRVPNEMKRKVRKSIEQRYNITNNDINGSSRETLTTA